MTERSSISSSKARVPRPCPRLLWPGGVLAALVASLAWSGYWSQRGFASAYVNGPRQWAEARASLGPESVVALGTSRAQAGIDPRAWAEVWPERPLVY